MKTFRQEKSLRWRMAGILLRAVFGVASTATTRGTISVGLGGNVAAEDPGEECYFHDYNGRLSSYLASLSLLLMRWIYKTRNEMMIMIFMKSMSSSDPLFYVLGAYFVIK